MDRNRALDSIINTDTPFDILIVGGGATGLGAALDAASRGHRVALLEARDFASGTSSRSTKLVHGGVRYLKQGNISLVIEALRERGRLARNAPHLVHDLAFVIPTYNHWDAPFYGIGMKVYDQLAGKLGLAPSRMLSREETIARIPTIETDRLTGGVIYHDGQFDDSRLAIHLALTADSLGASLVNHCRVVGLIREKGIVAGVLARDELGGREFSVRARAVINATGVFVDELRRQDDPQAPGLVSVSQGVHLVLPRRFLPGSTAIMVPKTSDGRVLFAIPWNDRVVVGTTDTPLPAPSVEPRALPQEYDFLMEHARKYLAQDPGDGDVLSVFAGLRPLVKTGEGPHTAALSRDHSIIIAGSGLLTITGGKWTTYRKMAEDVIDQAEMIAGVEGNPCQTETLRIHGWTDRPCDNPLLRAYGSDAQQVAALMSSAHGLAAPIHPGLPYLQAEVIWAVRHEMAQTVEDVLARRLRALLLDAASSIEAAPLVARLMARELGHPPAWELSQVVAYTAIARGYRHPTALVS